ncbi:MAG TPA: DUF2793 domain-containing protein [Holophaga sp.]|nr:DUF2793 domain-containing protein [Holophaga sp.]
MSLSMGPNLNLLVNGAQGDAHYAELMRLLRWLDFFMEPVVKQVGLTVPAASPSDGDAYVVGPSATGVWAGLDNRLVRWSAVQNAWESLVPKAGWHVLDVSRVPWFYTGSAWNAQVVFGGPVSLATYTVAALPAGSIGQVVFVSNGRKVAEGAGAGTGCVAAFSGGAWRRISDDAVVQA